MEKGHRHDVKSSFSPKFRIYIMFLGWVLMTPGGLLNNILI